MAYDFGGTHIVIDVDPRSRLEIDLIFVFESIREHDTGGVFETLFDHQIKIQRSRDPRNYRALQVVEIRCQPHQADIVALIQVD